MLQQKIYAFHTQPQQIKKINSIMKLYSKEKDLLLMSVWSYKYWCSEWYVNTYTELNSWSLSFYGSG